MPAASRTHPQKRTTAVMNDPDEATISPLSFQKSTSVGFPPMSERLSDKLKQLLNFPRKMSIVEPKRLYNQHFWDKYRYSDTFGRINGVWDGGFMAEKKEYRSAVRSRRMIRQAFMELLGEKPFEKITVSDIVKRADINRSTFYAHYPDIYGLVEEILDEVMDFTQQFRGQLQFGSFFQDPRPVLDSIVRLLEENQELYKRLGRSEFAMQQLPKLKQTFVRQVMESSDIPETVRNSPMFPIRIRFFIGGICDVYSQWLYGDLDCGLSDITEEFARQILKSAEDFLPLENR